MFTKMYPFSAKNYVTLNSYHSRVWEMIDDDCPDSLWNYACKVSALLHKLSKTETVWLTGSEIGFAKKLLNLINNGRIFPDEIYENA